jgi:D-alanyl-D-alanine-carboxypeptidase/D-alanyl-D-alanine-endopeptidase
VGLARLPGAYSGLGRLARLADGADIVLRLFFAILVCGRLRAGLPEFLDQSLQPYIASKSLAGVSVGVITPQGEIERYYGEGMSATAIVEIASVTKTFTGLLLADLNREGKVALDDPLQKYLPSGATAPDLDGREITLLDLATHTSGLPAPGPADGFLPAWYSPTGLRLLSLHLIHWNFYDLALGVRESDLDAALSKYRLKFKPGTHWEYSNLGMGLLGLALAKAAGEPDYESLLRHRIGEPLHLSDTWVNLPPGLQGRLIQGYNEGGKAAPHFNLGPLAAAGGLKSTLPDLMAYLRLQLGLPHSGPSGLLSSAESSHQVRRVLPGTPPRELPLSWHRDAASGMLYHSGAALGFHSWLGFIPGKKSGLVLFSNSAAQVIEEIGPELLKEAVGLPAAVPKPMIAVSLEAPALNRCTGAYLLDKTKLLVSREGDHLLIQFGSKSPSRIWPRSPSSYFCKEWDCRVDFRLPGEGPASEALIKMYYNSYAAKRIGAP